MSERTQDVSDVPSAYDPGDTTDTNWVDFAAFMLFGLGLFALMAAIAEALGSSWFLENTVFGTRLDWFWYGFFDLLVAIGSFYAGWAIWKGRAGGYAIGLLFATLSAGRWFLLIPKAPVWSVTMVVVWCLVVYALVKTEDYPT